MRNFKGLLLVWSLGQAGGTGKTKALCQWAENPKELLWIRNDPKPLSFPKEWLGEYHNIKNETNGKLRFEVGEWFCRLLDDVEKRGMKTKEGQPLKGIVVDLWYWVGECLCAMVDKAPSKYRENYSGLPQYKYPQIRGEGHIWQARVIDRMTEMFEFVGLSAHSIALRDSNGVPTGIEMPEARPEVLKAATDIWLLKREHGSYCPTILVTKQGAKDILTPGRGIETYTVLPERATPQNGDKSVWDIYERYFENPISLRQPLPEEIPTQTELSYIKGIMTPDQREFYKIAQLAKKRELESEPEIWIDPQDEEITAKIKELSASGLGPIEIMEFVNKPVEEGGFDAKFGPADIFERMK